MNLFTILGQVFRGYCVYDSSTGLYYDLQINNLDPGFDPNTVTNIAIKSSIFDLFPLVSLNIANLKNFYVQEKFCAAGGPLALTIGSAHTNEDDTLDVLEDFVIERWKNFESKSDLGGGLNLLFTNKNAQKILTAWGDRYLI